MLRAPQGVGAMLADRFDEVQRLSEEAMGIGAGIVEAAMYVARAAIWNGDARTATCGSGRRLP